MSRHTGILFQCLVVPEAFHKICRTFTNSPIQFRLSGQNEARPFSSQTRQRERSDRAQRQHSHQRNRCWRRFSDEHASSIGPNEETRRTGGKAREYYNPRLFDSLCDSSRGDQSRNIACRRSPEENKDQARRVEGGA